jgi:tRNA A-37 threonylcarbamoyl transferase component Bud32
MNDSNIVEDPSNGSMRMEHAINNCLDFFNSQLSQGVEAKLVDHSTGLYKSETIADAGGGVPAEVGYFTCEFTYNVNEINEEELLGYLDEISTNQKLRIIFEEQIYVAKLLFESLAGLQLELDSNIDIDTLYNFISHTAGKLLGFNTLLNFLLLYVTDINNVPVNFLLNFQQGIMHIRIPIVYKMVLLNNSQVKNSLQNEVEAYRTWSEKGINTFCALDYITGTDEGFVDYTLRELDLNLLENENELFNPEFDIFGQLMRELARVHKAGLTHGDLHFKNIAYKIINQRIILFFDLTRSISQSGGINVISDINVFIGALRYAINKLANKIDIATKEYILECIESYISLLQSGEGLQFNQMDIDTIRLHFKSIENLLEEIVPGSNGLK